MLGANPNPLKIADQRRKKAMRIYPYDFSDNCLSCFYFNKETGFCIQELPMEKIEKPTDETCGAWREKQEATTAGGYYKHI